jgi:hypothetical protein
MAGIDLAAVATATRNIHTKAKMSGSVAVTRNRRLDKNRVSKSETQTPAPVPISAVRRPCARINRAMLAFVAPVAMRTLISSNRTPRSWPAGAQWPQNRETSRSANANRKWNCPRSVPEMSLFQPEFPDRPPSQRAGFRTLLLYRVRF